MSLLRRLLKLLTGLSGSASRLLDVNRLFFDEGETFGGVLHRTLERGEPESISDSRSSAKVTDLADLERRTECSGSMSWLILDRLFSSFFVCSLS